MPTKAANTAKAQTAAVLALRPDAPFPGGDGGGAGLLTVGGLGMFRVGTDGVGGGRGALGVGTFADGALMVGTWGDRMLGEGTLGEGILGDGMFGEGIFGVGGVGTGGIT
ncbi:hypothetical protein PG994_000968 [Apiospora phragmitis]|uniref:Uncharacterized protein n=1 Tax=Apiospora phragmitis TaxID=2905665 RepID=A0ABR1WR26_9PEZI